MSALCHTKCRVLLWFRLELLCGADTVSGMPAALWYCNSTIACAKTIQDVQLEDMGCSVGEYNINALELEDKMCIRKSEKRIEILHENKESSRGR